MSKEFLKPTLKVFLRDSMIRKSDSGYLPFEPFCVSIAQSISCFNIDVDLDEIEYEARMVIGELIGDDWKSHVNMGVTCVHGLEPELGLFHYYPSNNMGYLENVVNFKMIEMMRGDGECQFEGRDRFSSMLVYKPGEGFYHAPGNISSAFDEKAYRSEIHWPCYSVENITSYLISKTGVQVLSVAERCALCNRIEFQCGINRIDKSSGMKRLAFRDNGLNIIQDSFLSNIGAMSYGVNEVIDDYYNESLGGLL